MNVPDKNDLEEGEIREDRTEPNNNDNSDIESIVDSDDDTPPPPPPHLEDDDDDTDIESIVDSVDNDDPLDDDQDNIINNQNNDNNIPFNINNQFEQFSDDNDDDDDDDDLEDDNYLQKFDENNQRQIIQDYHPELHQHNINEINTMATIIKDINGNIIDPLHKTLPFITKYEKARILGERSKQISAGAIPLINIDETVIDSYIIATKEFEEKAIPFIIKRPLPSGGCEYWKLEDLEILV